MQLDGVGGMDERILLVGATNRPQELDEAARRRMTKRLYIPLPDVAGREAFVRRLMRNQKCELTDADYAKIVQLSAGAGCCGYFHFIYYTLILQCGTTGYSGSDLNNVCSEAAMGPIREIKDILHADMNAVRGIVVRDFESVRMHLSQERPNILKLFFVSPGTSIDTTNGC